MNVSRSVIENFGPLLRVTSSWGLMEWGGLLVGTTAAAVVAVGFLNWVSSAR